jgi:AraC family transcriptional activator of pobA
MDSTDSHWHFADMNTLSSDTHTAIPAWSLYGESRAFPDVMHIERFTDRAAGLDWRIAPHRHLHLHQFFLIQSGRSDHHGWKRCGSRTACTPERAARSGP